MNDVFRDALTKIGLSLDDAQLAAIDAFEESLYAQNEVMNLTRVPRELAWTRHFMDSLLFHDLIPMGSKVVDIGTGPGLPAWPLALARPDLQVTAVDSNGKMLGFLRSQPLPNLEIIQVRAEEWKVREKFDVATGRALAPLAAQIELSAACVKIGGRIIPMRTPDEDFDSVRLERLGLKLISVNVRPLPGTDARRAFPIFEKIHSTDAKYPRRWSEIKARPLVWLKA